MRANDVDAKLIHCKRVRNRLVQTAIECNRRTLSAASVLKVRKPRRAWTFKKSGSFWEKDVPENEETFFKEAFRMERSNSNVLVSQLTALQKEDTYMKVCIPLEKRIAIALYALGSSAEYRTIGLLFGVSKSSVCKILYDFCHEVWRVLSPQYLSNDFLSEEIVEDCVSGFEVLGFPQCFGAIDGCHVEIRPEAKDAVDYYNYKGWHSVNLFALVDYRYRFLYINVGTPGRCNDSNIFEQSSLKQKLKDDILKQKAKAINGVSVPVVVLGNSAFKMSTSVMKPYPFSTISLKEQKTFNYALFKCRRVVENAFGHLKARFRRIGKGIDNDLTNVNAILKCVCVLHNFLNNNNSTINKTWIEEQAQHELSRKQEQQQRTIYLADYNADAEKIRSTLANFLCSTHDDVDGSEK